MISFITNIKKMISIDIQLAILGAIAVIVFFTTLASLTLVGVISYVIMVAALIFLALDRKVFAAHVVILVSWFENAAPNFATALLTFSFTTFGNAIFLALNFLIFCYLLIMIVSYMVSGDLIMQPISGNVALLLLCTLGYIWIFYGFNAFVMNLIILGVCLLFGNHMSLLLLIFNYIAIRVYFNINLWFNNVFTFMSLISVLIGLTIIGFIVVLFMKKTNKQLV